MRASSSSRAPVSTITCWILATSSSPRPRRARRAPARRARPARRSATARASSDVGLPSRRSSPTGLPVTEVSPNAPMTSSRIWKASPSGSPKQLRPGSSAWPRDRVGEHGAEVQRALDRVLAALVAGDPLGLVEAPLALHRAEDVEELADVELDAQLVPQLPHLGRGAGQQLVGEHEGEVADEDRHALAEAPRLAGPVGLAVRRRRTRRASSARPAGWPSRPSRRRGTGRRRASARSPRRPARPRSSAGSPPAPTKPQWQNAGRRRLPPERTMRRISSNGPARSGSSAAQRDALGRQQVVEARIDADGDRRQRRRRARRHMAQPTPDSRGETLERRRRTAAGRADGRRHARGQLIAGAAGAVRMTIRAHPASSPLSRSAMTSSMRSRASPMRCGTPRSARSPGRRGRRGGRRRRRRPRARGGCRRARRAPGVAGGGRRSHSRASSPSGSTRLCERAAGQLGGRAGRRRRRRPGRATERDRRRCA